MQDSICNICGNGEEDEHHAIVACTKSRALRQAMREVWLLPPEKSFRFTGCDWLQVLLSTETEDMRAKVLLLLWRCWHLRDDCIHGRGRETIKESVLFLSRYDEELKSACLGISSVTGKDTGSLTNPKPCISTQPSMHWTAPVRGMVKINSDAAFTPDSGQSWAGAVSERPQRTSLSVSLQTHVFLMQR